MTATLVKAPAVKKPAPSQEAIEFAAAVVGGLKGLLHAVAENPEIAPLVAYALRNMCSPLDWTGDAEQAVDMAARAFASEGAVIEQADDAGLLGVVARFGPVVSMWLCRRDPEQLAQVPVEADNTTGGGGAEEPEADASDTDEPVASDVEVESAAEQASEVAA